jgi:Tfp pilus assembly protein PilF
MNSLDEKFNTGMAAFASQNYGVCIENLTEVLKKDTTHKLALVARGAAFLRTGETTTAMADFDSALEIDPGYARACHLRGLAREVKGDDEGALADFARAIELKPDYAAAYYSRATLYTKLGQMDLADEDSRMATHLTEYTIQTFANENNIWRSDHMAVEDMMETELNR